MPAPLTQARLREKLSYNPETGEFRWRVLPQRYGGTDRRAGTPRGEGAYLLIRIDYSHYYAHRLAWLYAHGRFPEEEIDHIDGDPQNNRMSNLRPATRRQNAKNRKRSSANTSGAKGVRFEPDRGKYLVRIGADGKYRHVGRYLSFEDAKAAYARAAQTLHGEFANLGA